MAYNVLYEDSNKFTKKLKNSLYEFSIPEDANLFTVSANNVREINLNSIGEEKGAFIYLYIISIKNGYVQYNNNSELLYINRNDSLVILNSETEIRLFITNEDENYPSGDMADYNRASASYNEYENKANEEFNQKLLSSLMNKLSPREKEIIKMRFGLSDDNGLKREYEREEIGQKLGLTAERVRQLEAEAMDKMKKEYTSRIGKFI
jgi:RNA polymerase sigma factor (sigma-70 family)